MLISNGSRQCVLRLQKYSDKRAGALSHTRQHLTDNNSHSKNDGNHELSDLRASNSQLTDTVEDRSLLGQFLNCPPCKKVTKRHRDKKVMDSHS